MNTLTFKKDRLFSLIDEGRITTQIATHIIGREPKPDSEETITIPEDYLMTVSYKGARLLPSKTGFLHFSRKGWNALKDEIKTRYEHAIANGMDRGKTWVDFESETEAYYNKIAKSVEKEKDSLLKKIELLNSYEG
jgi:hypothetical protein